MDHNRPISPHDREVLILLQKCQGHVVLTPVFLNGESRLAIAIFGESPGGSYVRILGFVTNPTDVIQDSEGQVATPSPPKVEKGGSSLN